MSNDLYNVLDVGWRMQESILNHYEDIFYDHKEKSKKSKLFRENIEPYLHKSLKLKSISQSIFLP